MKVLYVAASNSRSFGGLFATMSATTKLLRSKGIEVALLAANDEHSAEDATAYRDVPQYSYEKSSLPILKQIGFSSKILPQIERFHPDIIHLQGLWQYCSAAVLRYAKHHPEVKVIIQPHGMLDPWAVKNSAWKKRIVGRLYEYENLLQADCIHALCQSEAEAVRLFGLDNPIAIIPNGINLPDMPLNEILTRRSASGGRKTLLFIGRIHPKKGIHELIEALDIISTKNPKLLKDWQVKIAGWDQLNHTAELKELIKTRGLDNCVRLIGAAFGEDKEHLLTEATAFILPSFSEGLPMTVLEAWAYALPVVMTPQCNIPEGFDAEAALRCDPHPESIATTLTCLFTSSTERLAEIGLRGRQLVQARFTWDNVADRIIDLYKSLVPEK